MRVEPLVPDIAQPVAPQSAPAANDAFAEALDAVGALLDGAGRSEDLYAKGLGSLQNAVVERAQADVALSIATAAAQRGVQAMQSILNMQV